MPTVTVDDHELHYVASGEGPTVVFVGDLGFGAWAWSWQFPALAGPYRAVVWDMRGVGRSSTPPAPDTIGAVTADLAGVVGAVGAQSIHLIGAGYGGAVALEYARKHAHVRSLILVGTTATGGEPAVDPVPLERAHAPPGDEAAIEETFSVLVSPEFLRQQRDAIEWMVEQRSVEDADTEAWRAHRRVYESIDCRDHLHEITCPALVLHGAADPIVAPTAGGALADGLPRGRFVEIDRASHLVWIERSRQVNDEIVGFLDATAQID